MASTVVNESIIAKVEEITKKGKEGSYKAKVVKVEGKDYTVSKNDSEKVKVGQEYEFKLTKSEYNDKLYYWANLIQKESQADNTKDQDEFKREVFAWLDSLPKEQRVATIKYLIDKL